MGDIRRHPWLKASIDAFADTVSELGPVLDVGCGPGTVTAYLAERGLDVSGVDLSPDMIENARRLYPHCRFSVASATDLSLGHCSTSRAASFLRSSPCSRGLGSRADTSSPERTSATRTRCARRPTEVCPSAGRRTNGGRNSSSA
ncbi:class I SAM-dependent methyltransferase [Streptomyces sp. NBC_01537]